MRFNNNYLMQEIEESYAATFNTYNYKNSLFHILLAKFLLIKSSIFMDYSHYWVYTDQGPRGNPFNLQPPRV
jgi:hypothetical protein